MQRVTITIDEELMSALDQYMETGGHQNRSEAVRDLVRAGLLKRPEADDSARHCVAALVYVYDHETRQLSKRLMNDHHSHADMSIATLHVHMDEATCLEVSLLKGQKSDVEHFAGHVIGERGVRYGQLVVLPSDVDQRDALPHDHHPAGRHAHSSN
ncbi:MAG: nickel-responsive transcriptional regulator NikR [Methylocystis sp.]|uniref:nickel-responsive transcriptional regulator NikR n=1 Tax=Methylocystis sp. TaxID=1911079 RepID=UPI003D10A460